MSRGESIQTYGLAAAGMAIGLPKAAYEVYVQEPGTHHDQERRARIGKGIIGLLTYISIYDTLSDKTISAEYREFGEQDTAVAYALLIATGAHMVGKLPFDPIDKFAGGARQYIRSKFMGKNSKPHLPNVRATIGA